MSVEKVQLRLRYWNIRGVAQAVRYMLEELAYQHQNVDYQEDFEDVQTCFTTWSERKFDPAVSGPYRLLPVLHWNEKQTFGEVLTIAHLLARKFDLYGKPTEKYPDPILLEAHLNGVATSAYTNVTGTSLMCFWKKPDVEGASEDQSLQRIRVGLDALNVMLKQSSTAFFGDQTEPTIADYFALEAYTVTRDIHRKLLPSNCDALEKLTETMKRRPALANYFQSGKLFQRFTAAPDEDEYRKTLAKSQ